MDIILINSINLCKNAKSVGSILPPLYPCHNFLLATYYLSHINIEKYEINENRQLNYQFYIIGLIGQIEQAFMLGHKIFFSRLCM